MAQIAASTGVAAAFPPLTGPFLCFFLCTPLRAQSVTDWKLAWKLDYTFHCLLQFLLTPLFAPAPFISLPLSSSALCSLFFFAVSLSASYRLRAHFRHRQSSSGPASFDLAVNSPRQLRTLFQLNFCLFPKRLRWESNGTACDFESLKVVLF